MKNENQSKNEYILEQKLYIVNELISIIRKHYIPQVKKLCKENKDIQLKLLNVKTEILKIDDKLEDILNLNSINDINEMNNTVSQVLNMINEEKAAYLIKEDNSNNINTKILQNNNISDSSSQILSEEDIEEKKIRKSFEELMDQENRSYYDLIKEDEGFPDNYDDYSMETDGEEDPGYESYKEYKYDYYKEFYALVNSENVKYWRKEDFGKYMDLRQKGSVKVTFCDDKKGNIRIYSKYQITGLIKGHDYKNKKGKEWLSKRQLPTEVFTYLISNNIIKEENFKDFSTNQFGRTFETKMGDIVLEKDLPKEKNRQKRYEKVDFSDSEYKQSEFKGILYFSNQWDEDSIFKFIKYIRKHYNDQIMIIDPHKQLIEDIKANKLNADIISAQFHYDKDNELDEIEYKVKSEDK